MTAALVPVPDPSLMLADAHPLAREWDALADRTRAGVLSRPGWLRAWWRAFGRGRLELLTCRQDGRLTAVLPIRRRGSVIGSPTNWHSARYTVLAEDSAAADDLLATVVGRRPGWLDVSFVDRVDADRLTGLAAAAGYRTVQRTVQRAPYVRVDGDWPAYEKQIGAKVLREMSRRRRKLERAGPVRVLVEDGGDRLGELLEEGFAVEAAGWKGARGTAIVSLPETRRFYTELAEWARDRGWLRLAFLRLGEQALAFDLALEHDGVHYLVKTGYDPAFAAYGPGKLLRYEMLARAFAHGATAYEFLGTDEAWKYEWTGSTHERQRVQAFARSPLGTGAWAVNVPGRAAAVKVLERTSSRHGARSATRPGAAS